MRILLIAALVSSVAVAGCRGGDKNESTSANNSASANGAAAAPGGAGGSTAAAFRQMAVTQCQSTVQQIPNAPAGVDANGICSCAIETAFGNQADPLTYARTQEGQQALTQAIVSCGRQQAGAAKGAAK